MFRNCFLLSFITGIPGHFRFDVPVDSSVTEEQLTRPKRKFSHFGMAVLGGGGVGVKKKRPLAVLRDRGGNGRCPLAEAPRQTDI